MTGQTGATAAWEALAVTASFLLVDDHPLFIEALQLAIRSAYPEARIEQANSIAMAKGSLKSSDRFDLILLDLSMPGTRGFDGLIELRSLYPKLPIVIVSAMEDARIVHEAMTCGAAGFIPKSVKKTELAEAIREVMTGSVVLPKGYSAPSTRTALSNTNADLAARLATLTPQQMRVLHMLRQGKLNKQIAFELDVGETTVKAHVSEILRKLSVASRTQAVIEVARIDFDEILSGGPLQQK